MTTPCFTSASMFGVRASLLPIQPELKWPKSSARKKMIWHRQARRGAQGWGGGACWDGRSSSARGWGGSPRTLGLKPSGGAADSALVAAASGRRSTIVSGAEKRVFRAGGTLHWYCTQELADSRHEISKTLYS